MADGGWQMAEAGGCGHPRSRHPRSRPLAKPPSGEARPPALAHHLLGTLFVQYTIEARELTTPRSLFDPHTIVEAPSERDAIQRYVEECHAELVSMTKPPNGGESIATIKREDAIVLVRVYAA